MKVEFSSAFIKAARKLSGKMLESLKRTTDLGLIKIQSWLI